MISKILLRGRDAGYIKLFFVPALGSCGLGGQRTSWSVWWAFLELDIFSLGYLVCGEFRGGGSRGGWCLWRVGGEFEILVVVSPNPGIISLAQLRGEYYFTLFSSLGELVQVYTIFWLWLTLGQIFSLVMEPDRWRGIWAEEDGLGGDCAWGRGFYLSSIECILWRGWGLCRRYWSWGTLYYRLSCPFG